MKAADARSGQPVRYLSVGIAKGSPRTHVTRPLREFERIYSSPDRLQKHMIISASTAIRWLRAFLDQNRRAVYHEA